MTHARLTICHRYAVLAPSLYGVQHFSGHVGFWSRGRCVSSSSQHIDSPGRVRTWTGWNV